MVLTGSWIQFNLQRNTGHNITFHYRYRTQSVLQLPFAYGQSFFFGLRREKLSPDKSSPFHVDEHSRVSLRNTLHRLEQFPTLESCGHNLPIWNNSCRTVIFQAMAKRSLSEWIARAKMRWRSLLRLLESGNNHPTPLAYYWFLSDILLISLLLVVCLSTNGERA